MTRRSGMALAAVALGGCTATSFGDPYTPNVQVAVDGTNALETPLVLEPTDYLSRPQIASFQLLNLEADPMYVSVAPLEAEGAELLQIDLPPFTEVLPDQPVLIEISLDDRPWMYSTGDYSVPVGFEIRYFFVGQEQGTPAAAFGTTEPVVSVSTASLTVEFSIDCDLDGDGFDAVECGGLDCDDGDAGVSPDAIEACNFIDDDCDGGVDEGASDRPTWYFDGDADGYGTPDDTTLSCLPPTVYWSDVSTDCDDTAFTTNPGATEICFDGIDNDCDTETDEGC